KVAASSLSEKYQCPEVCVLKLLISPTTATSWKLFSSTALICAVNCDTVWIGYGRWLTAVFIDCSVLRMLLLIRRQPPKSSNEFPLSQNICEAPISTNCGFAGFRRLSGDLFYFSAVPILLYMQIACIDGAGCGF